MEKIQLPVLKRKRLRKRVEKEGEGVPFSLSSSDGPLVDVFSRLAR